MRAPLFEKPELNIGTPFSYYKLRFSILISAVNGVYSGENIIRDLDLS